MPGSVPKASDSLSAIGAVKDARPFKRRERVERATRRRLAATVTWTSPRYSRRISPGWAGLYIVIGIFLVKRTILVLAIRLTKVRHCRIIHM